MVRSVRALVLTLSWFRLLASLDGTEASVTRALSGLLADADPH